MRRFLDRRATLTPEARDRLARDMATRLGPKVVGPPRQWEPEACPRWRRHRAAGCVPVRRRQRPGRLLRRRGGGRRVRVRPGKGRQGVRHRDGRAHARHHLRVAAGHIHRPARRLACHVLDRGRHRPARRDRPGRLASPHQRPARQLGHERAGRSAQWQRLVDGRRRGARHLEHLRRLHVHRPVRHRRRPARTPRSSRSHSPSSASAWRSATTSADASPTGTTTAV